MKWINSTDFLRCSKGMEVRIHDIMLPKVMTTSTLYHSQSRMKICIFSHSLMTHLTNIRKTILSNKGFFVVLISLRLKVIFMSHAYFSVMNLKNKHYLSVAENLVIPDLLRHLCHNESLSYHRNLGVKKDEMLIIHLALLTNAIKKKKIEVTGSLLSPVSLTSSFTKYGCPSSPFFYVYPLPSYSAKTMYVAFDECLICSEMCG